MGQNVEQCRKKKHEDRVTEAKRGMSQASNREGCMGSEHPHREWWQLRGVGPHNRSADDRGIFVSISPRLADLPAVSDKRDVRLMVIRPSGQWE